MVELKNKYQIGVRRFNINWIGAYSLYKKETLRFLTVFGQTIVGPTITAVLFLVVISLALGDLRSDVLGVKFISFLAPGLIAMQVIQQSFSHSSSSLLMGKIMGNIVDVIGAPLSAGEVTLSVILASVTRALIIAAFSIVVFAFFIEIEIKNFSIFFTYLFLSSFIMGAVGFIAGLWAEKFDHIDCCLGEPCGAASSTERQLIRSMVCGNVLHALLRLLAEATQCLMSRMRGGWLAICALH